jgi:hypothetical protein
MSALHRRLFAPAFSSSTTEDVTVDFGTLAERLLLYDTYVLHSLNLLEVPHLVRQFGIEAVIRLFKSDAVELSVDKSAITLLEPEHGSSDPYVVHPAAVYLNQPASTEADFAHLRASFEVRNLSQWRSLNGALRRAVEAAPLDLTRLRQTTGELMSDFNRAALTPERLNPFVRAALARAGIDPGHEPIRFVVSETDRRYGVDTDLETRFDLSVQRAGDIVREAFIGLSSEASRVHEMRLYNALVPFDTSESPLYASHLAHAARLADPDVTSESFQRVVTLKGLPDLRAPEVATTLDLHRLLNLRESPEGRAFRDWIRTVHTLSDAEVEEQLEAHVATLAERFGGFLTTRRGRQLRWLLARGAGKVAGAAAGATAGVATTALVGPEAGLTAATAAATIANEVVGGSIGYANAFLLDRVIPTTPEESLPSAFLDPGYKSLFAPPDLPDSTHEERVEHD